MNTQTVNKKEAQLIFPDLLKYVASGGEVIISDSGEPIARISRIEKQSPKIRFGVLKGKVEISEDFDEPLPDSLLDAFEGNECDF